MEVVEIERHLRFFSAGVTSFTETYKIVSHPHSTQGLPYDFYKLWEVYSLFLTISYSHCHFLFV